MTFENLPNSEDDDLSSGRAPGSKSLPSVMKVRQKKADNQRTMKHLDLILLHLDVLQYIWSFFLFEAVTNRFIGGMEMDLN